MKIIEVSVVIPAIYYFDVQQKTATQLFFEYSFQNPALLFATVAVTYIQQRLRRPAPTFSDLPDQLDCKSLFYKIQSIRLVNEALMTHDRAFQVPIIWAVTILLYMEIATGIEQDINTHRLGLLQLLKVRGGMWGLPGVLIDLICPQLHRASQTLNEKPLFPPPRSGKPLSPERARWMHYVLRLSPYQHLCDGFGGLTVEPLLNSELRRVIQAYRWHYQSRESHRLDVTFRVDSDGHSGPSMEEIEYLIYRTHEARYMLLAMLCDDFETLAQECICAAFALFTAATDKWFGSSSRVVRSIIPRLKAALQRSDLRFFWNPNHELLIWMLSMGAFLSIGQPEHPWFVYELARGAQLLDVKSAEGMRQVLLRFAYLDAGQLDFLQQIWLEVESLMEVLPSQWHP